MSKTKIISTGKVLAKSDDNFDWSLYEDGYNGGSSLKVNKKVKTKNPKDKVFCHESYAQELYDMMENHSQGKSFTAKDEVVGTVYTVTDIRVKSDHEILVDSDNGISMSIDLNKEKQYIDTFDGATVSQFTDALKNNELFKKHLIESGMRVKVTDRDKVSLWEGRKSYIEEEFVKQYSNQSEKKYAYIAKVLSINNGGYIVDVMGMKCFMPGSLASAGVVTNFEELLGKELYVMVVNYVTKTKCWVVSHKKYVEYIMPNKIETELSVGQNVNCKVSGTSKNGIFVSFPDKDGEWIFTGLCHRSVMSSALQELFDTKNIVPGDQIHLMITAINYVDGKPRVVLGDKMPDVTTEEKVEVSE